MNNGGKTMNYEELKTKQQMEVNAFPLGFAFGQDQFNEMMQKWDLDPVKDLDKIYSIGGGGFIRKTDSEAMEKMFERHEQEMNELLEDPEKLEEAIFYEMKNHEYFYNSQRNWDVMSCFGAVEYDEYDDPENYFDQLKWSEDKRQAFRNARKRMFKLEKDV